MIYNCGTCSQNNMCARLFAITAAKERPYSIPCYYLFALCQSAKQFKNCPHFHTFYNSNNVYYIEWPVSACVSRFVSVLVCVCYNHKYCFIYFFLYVYFLLSAPFIWLFFLSSFCCCLCLMSNIKKYERKKFVWLVCAWCVCICAKVIDPIFGQMKQYGIPWIQFLKSAHLYFKFLFINTQFMPAKNLLSDMAVYGFCTASNRFENCPQCICVCLFDSMSDIMFHDPTGQNLLIEMEKGAKYLHIVGLYFSLQRKIANEQVKILE